MSEENALQPIEQKQVTFYEDQIVAARVEGGAIYVPVRPICDVLGIGWSAQARKLRDDPVLAEVSRSVIIRSQSSGTSGKRDAYNMICLPLDYLNGWLFGINSRRVREDLRESIIRYQRDCYRVLFEAFTLNKVTHRPASDDIETWLRTNDDPTAVAYRQGMAIANLAREQALMKAELSKRIDSAEFRIDAIEAELGNPDRFITVSQAEQISQAVRAVALVFSKATGNNEYGSVYGELYRRYSINSYKRLAGVKFEDAMNWLKQWYEDLTDGEAAPF